MCADVVASSPEVARNPYQGDTDCHGAKAKRPAHCRVDGGHRAQQILHARRGQRKRQPLYHKY